MTMKQLLMQLEAPWGRLSLSLDTLEGQLTVWHVAGQGREAAMRQADDGVVPDGAPQHARHPLNHLRLPYPCS